MGLGFAVGEVASAGLLDSAATEALIQQVQYKEGEGRTGHEFHICHLWLPRGASDALFRDWGKECRAPGSSLSNLTVDLFD